MRQVLRNRWVWVLALAETVSNVGNWISMIAVFSLVVFVGEGGVQETSGVMLSALVPMVVMSPLAGWVADRFNRKWLMITSEVLSGVLVVGLILSRSLWMLYLFLALGSVSGSLLRPARQAALPDLVEKAELGRANAFLQQVFAITKMGAPVLAGMVLTVLTPQQAMVLDIISYGISAMVLLFLPSLPSRRDERVRPVGGAPAPAAAGVGEAQDGEALAAAAVGGGGAQAGEASAAADCGAASRTRKAGLLGALRQTAREIPWMGAIVGAGFLVGFQIVAVDVTAPVITRDLLHQGEGFFGLLISLVGMGSVAGPMGLMVRRRAGNQWRDTAWGLLLMATVPLSLAGAAWVNQPALARLAAPLGFLVGGMGIGIATVQVNTIIQTLAPAGWVGRLSGAMQSAVTGGQVIGILVTPLVVPGLLSLAAYFALGAFLIVGLALGVWQFARRPHLQGVGVQQAGESAL